MMMSILLAVLAGVFFQSEWYAATIVAGLLCLVVAMDRLRQVMTELLKSVRVEQEAQPGLDYSDALDDER